MVSKTRREDMDVWREHVYILYEHDVVCVEGEIGGVVD